MNTNKSLKVLALTVVLCVLVFGVSYAYKANHAKQVENSKVINSLIANPDDRVLSKDIPSGVSLPTEGVTPEKTSTPKKVLVPDAAPLDLATGNGKYELPARFKTMTTDGNIVAGGITLLSPLNNEKIPAGKAIQIKYQITKHVTLGSIMIMCEGTGGVFSIENKDPGVYSFDCKLPENVQRQSISVMELLYNDLENSPTTLGQIILVQPAGTSIVGIDAGDAGFYSQESMFLQATPKVMNDGFIYPWFILSNGVKLRASAKDFSITIADPSIATLFSKDGTIQIDAKKIGITTMTISYKGFTKKISINVSPCDDTLDDCKPLK